VDFEWFPGFALSQQQKSIASLHRAAQRRGVRRPLEISSKSPEELGRGLSAFNLRVEHPEHGSIPLESAFQAAKRFSRGGPFAELALATPRDARGDPRLRSSGLLLGFQWGDARLPNRPPTAFYDWLYLRALGLVDEDVRRQVPERDGFTDIAFNPEKSLNCQARSAALYVALARAGIGSPWVLDFESFVVTAYTPGT
jgi:type I restriction enzyme M protein